QEAPDVVVVDAGEEVAEVVAWRPRASAGVPERQAVATLEQQRRLVDHRLEPQLGERPAVPVVHLHSQAISVRTSHVDLQHLRILELAGAEQEGRAEKPLPARTEVMNADLARE